MKHADRCVTCGQTVQVYRRTIRPNMVWCLKRLYEQHGFQAKKTTEIDERKVVESDFTKLKYWGLIEGDGHNRYNITPLGFQFLYGHASVPKYKWIYAGRVQPDPPGEPNPLIEVTDIIESMMGRDRALKESQPVKQFGQKQGELFQ